MFPSDLFEAIRESLNEFETDRLNDLLRKADGWFQWTKEDGVGDEVQMVLASQDREAKIEYILGGDPLLADGGLVDFLQSENIVIPTTPSH